MRYTNSSAYTASLPVKQWLIRLGFAGLLLFSILLILLSRNDSSTLSAMRMTVSDGITPIIALLSEPANILTSVSSVTQGWASLREQNATLRAEKERLLQWQNIAHKLETENKRLRTLLAMQRDVGLSYISGKVIGHLAGSHQHALRLNIGARDGVKQHQAVVTAEGLVGRVLEVGTSSSRILTVTDINSRIPVMIEGTHQRAILAGDNSVAPRLIHVPKDTKLTIGTRIVTSADGKVMPANLVIGEVVKSDDNAVRVQPYVNWGMLDYVKLVSEKQQ